ncbi:MAG: hypothetical protein JST85_00880 [Acidobacteria bacterium]|nr:hypothetical protein [Acidobacteriota bacterium]
MKFVRGGEWDVRPQAPFFEGQAAFINGGRAISYAEQAEFQTAGGRSPVLHQTLPT